MPVISISRTHEGRDFRRSLLDLLPGLALVVGVSIGAMLLQSTVLFSRQLPLSSLILAIVLGMGLANSIQLPVRSRPGIKFAARQILRLAIIFLGFKLSMAQIAGIGPKALAATAIGSTATLLLSLWLGRRLGVPMKRALLLGSGVSICGASAVAAVGGVVDADEKDAAFAIGAVTLFGTAFMFLYPLARALMGMPGLLYALWTGSSIHEVAQVAAASSVLPDSLRGIAATVKMIRVLFVVPLTLVLSFIPFDGPGGAETPAGTPAGAAAGAPRGGRRVSVPWFALLFFAAVILNSVAPFAAGTRAALAGFDGWLMTAAMAGLGLDIRMRSFASIGPRAALLGALASILISGLSVSLIILFHAQG